MKLITLLLLSSLSLTAKAELTLSETSKLSQKPGATTNSEKTTENSDNKSDIVKDETRDEVKEEIKEAVKEITNVPVAKTELESLTTSSNIYSLTVTPSRYAQTYSLKVSKENKIYLNAKYYANPTDIEHKIELAGGLGTYKIEYIEYDSVNVSKNKIFAKIINLVYKIPEMIRNIKTSKWVQARDPRITSLSASIVSGLNGEYDKVIAIDAWITRNVVYNNTSTMMSQEIDAITTLELRMGICTGYSNLFAALARASGLETKVITGRAKIDGKNYYHQWNEVKIDGTWYFIDTTWNAGRKKRSFFTKVSDYPETYRGRKEVKPY